MLLELEGVDILVSIKLQRFILGFRYSACCWSLLEVLEGTWGDKVCVENKVQSSIAETNIEMDFLYARVSEKF